VGDGGMNPFWLQNRRPVARRLAPALVALTLTLTACASAQSPAATGSASAGVATESVGGASPVPSAVRPIAHQPLPAGTYTSEAFATPLTYTVPDGWKMFEDEQGQFGLALVAHDGPCLCVWRDVSVAAASCVEEPEPGVGTAAADIVGWLADHEGLDTSQPEETTIGGLDGYVIDVAMDAAWAEACPFSGGQPIVMTLVGGDISAGVHWGTDAGSSQRYYLLDLGEGGADGNIAITLEVCCGAEWDERMAAATPVIESFVFDAGG
jgi:hypothetical protein